jgi:GntR family transcriptional regulator/MocR family aminotransferase
MGRRAVGLLGALAKERQIGLSDQLVEVIRELIVEGVWKPGEKLPGSRMIARDAKVSRSTVLTAIDTLTAEGLLEARDRSGTYVAWSSSAAVAPLKRKPTPPKLGELAAFECCLPPLDLFPIHTWRRLQSRRWWSMPRSALQESHGAGLPELREAIATQLHISRGIKCEPEQVIVTTGAEAAILMAATALKLRGAQAWTENPTYARQRAALSAAGLTPVSVRLDAQGLDVAQAKAVAPNARLAVVTPSSQFPTTLVMSASRKRELLDWAVGNDGWIIEDDYDCEYAPAAAKPMAAMPGCERVIYVNTFSRSLFLSLRIGYVVVPPALVDPMLQARGAIDEHTTAPNQLVLCDFVTAGHFSRHLRRCREAFAARREALLAELNVHAPEGLSIVNSAAASHLCVRLPQWIDDAAVQARATSVGVVTKPLSPHWTGDARASGILLGFAAHPPEAIRDGVARLAPVWRMLDGGETGVRSRFADMQRASSD